MARIIALFIMAALSGCASITPLTPPPGDSGPGRKVSISGRLPSDGEKWAAATSIPGTYFGVSGGSGIPIFGLFGVIGASANQLLIQSANAKLGASVSALTTANLAELLRDVSGLEIKEGAHTNEYRLTPAARLYFVNEQRFYLSCILNVEYDAGAAQWKAIYDVNPDAMHSTTDGPEAVIVTLKTCLTDAHVLFTEHVSGSLGPTQNRTVKVIGMTITAPTHTTALPSRVIVNYGFGVQQIRRSAVLAVE